MTSGKKEKRRVREQAEKCGMSYQAALQQPLRDGASGEPVPPVDGTVGTGREPSSGHHVVCLREFQLLLEIYMWIPRLYVDPGSALLQLPVTFPGAAALAREACTRVVRSRSSEPEAHAEVEAMVWKSLPWERCLVALERAQQHNRSKQYAVRLGREGELAAELILAMPTIVDSPQRIVDAIEVASLMGDDGFVRRSTRKRYHVPIDGETIGIFHCKGCFVYREHLLVDADKDDPRFAIQCWQCKYTIPGSYSTWIQRPGVPMVRTYDKPFISDDDLAIAHDRIRDLGQWVGRAEPLPGAKLILDHHGAGRAADSASV